MGLLNSLSSPAASSLVRLPSGSFTIDPQGRVIASTLPQSFPAARVRDIGQAFLQTFRAAETAHLPVNELVVEYAALKLTAKALRGGAIIFVAPRLLK
ncbi:MAG: hypothetical protein AB1813_16790 [Verrucomicrobiota bacterium]|jgi:hypothetical protein